MAGIFSSFVQVHPNYTAPEIILPFMQQSGAFETLAGAEPMVRIGTEDQQVYITTLDVRTKVSAGQQPYGSIPSCSISAQQISTPTYLMRTRAEYDHHDTAMAAQWKVGLPEAQKLACRQGMFQLFRNALLYGFTPANGEGLLNTAGATSVTLPADPFGNTTVRTYDNGAMAFYLLSLISGALTRMNQIGVEGLRVVILAPQQEIAAWTFQDIVQLTSVQREGAGSLNIAETVAWAAKNNGITVDFACDDTLINQGAGGNTDAVLVVVPEIKKPGGEQINTNEFAKLTPGLLATTIQYCDMAAPREIPIPLPMGAVDVTFEQRITSGWGVRPEGITICSMPY